MLLKVKNIKNATIKDIDDIEKIISQSLVGVGSGDNANKQLVSLFKDDVVLTIEKNHPDKTQRYLVARNDDHRAVAYIGYKKCSKSLLPFTYTDKPLEINALYIISDELGNGIRNNLVQHIRYTASEKRHTEIIMQSGNHFKKSTWGFLETLGFEKIGVLPGEETGEYAVFRLKI